MMIAPENDYTKKINWKEICQELKDKDLPCTREVLSLLETLDPEDEISFQELASYILKDYGLTKKVIQLANSCFHNPSGTEIVTVSRALLFLGLDTVKEIVLVSSYLEEVVKNISPENRHQVLRLLSQSFLVAFFGNRVASFINLASEELFVQFLFHRLMRLLLALHFPKVYETVEQIEKSNPSLVREKLYWLGVRLSREWSLPSALKETLEGSPKSSEKGHPAYLVEKITFVTEDLLKGKKFSLAIEELKKDLKVDLEEEVLKKSFEDAVKAGVELYKPFEDFLLSRENKAFEESPSEDIKNLSREELFQQALSEITSYLASHNEYQKVIFMVIETIKRVMETEAVFFGVYKPGENKISLRFGVGKTKNLLRGKCFFAGEVLKEIFAKKVEWTSRVDAVPELWHIATFKDRDVLFSPVYIRNKPLGMILAFRNEPFSNDEKGKLNILRNLISLAIDKSLSQT